MSDALLELRGVSKTYRIRGAGGSHDLAAVTDLDLSVAPGEIVALVGESGAGKSTVARLVLGMERAEKGDIIFEGQELSRARERTLRRITGPKGTVALAATVTMRPSPASCCTVSWLPDRAEWTMSSVPPGANTLGASAQIRSRSARPSVPASQARAGPRVGRCSFSAGT